MPKKAVQIFYRASEDALCLGSEMLSRSSHSLKHNQPWRDDIKKSRVPFAVGSAGDTGRTDLSHCLIAPLRQPGTPAQRPVPTRSHELPKPCGTTTVPSPATLTVRPLCQPGVYSPGDSRTMTSIRCQRGDPDSPGPASAAGEVHGGWRARGTGGLSHPQPTPVFSRTAFPKEPVGSRSFPPAPRAKENRLCRCLFVCRGCGPSL